MVNRRLSTQEHRLDTCAPHTCQPLRNGLISDNRHGPRFMLSSKAPYVHLIVTESNNGASLSGTRPFAPKRHNAKHCPFAIRERIVNALANGDSKRAIARALRVSIHTINAVAEQEWQRVAARKAKLAARYEKLADLVHERGKSTNWSLAQSIPLISPNTGGGIATDKAMVLRGDPALTIQHDVVLRQQSQLESIRKPGMT